MFQAPATHSFTPTREQTKTGAPVAYTGRLLHQTPCGTGYLRSDTLPQNELPLVQTLSHLPIPMLFSVAAGLRGIVVYSWIPHRPDLLPVAAESPLVSAEDCAQCISLWAGDQDREPRTLLRSPRWSCGINEVRRESRIERAYER